MGQGLNVFRTGLSSFNSGKREIPCRCKQRRGEEHTSLDDKPAQALAVHAENVAGKLR
jgi:hypothetical protein